MGPSAQGQLFKHGFALSMGSNIGLAGCGKALKIEEGAGCRE